MAEAINLKARLPGRLIRDGDDVDVVLFKEQAAIDILTVARKFFLNKKLGDVEHHFGTELMKVEKLNYRQ